MEFAQNLDKKEGGEKRGKTRNSKIERGEHYEKKVHLRGRTKRNVCSIRIRTNHQKSEMGRRERCKLGVGKKSDTAKKKSVHVWSRHKKKKSKKSLRAPQRGPGKEENVAKNKQSDKEKSAERQILMGDKSKRKEENEITLQRNSKKKGREGKTSGVKKRAIHKPNKS